MTKEFEKLVEPRAYKEFIIQYYVEGNFKKDLAEDPLAALLKTWITSYNSAIDEAVKIVGNAFEELGFNNESIHLGYYRHDDIENCEKEINNGLKQLRKGGE